MKLLRIATWPDGTALYRMFDPSWIAGLRVLSIGRRTEHALRPGRGAGPVWHVKSYVLRIQKSSPTKISPWRTLWRVDSETEIVERIRCDPKVRLLTKANQHMGVYSRGNQRKLKRNVLEAARGLHVPYVDGLAQNDRLFLLPTTPHYLIGSAELDEASPQLDPTGKGPGALVTLPWNRRARVLNLGDRNVSYDSKVAFLLYIAGRPLSFERRGDRILPARPEREDGPADGTVLQDASMSFDPETLESYRLLGVPSPINAREKEFLAWIAAVSDPDS